MMFHSTCFLWLFLCRLPKTLFHLTWRLLCLQKAISRCLREFTIECLSDKWWFDLRTMYLLLWGHWNLKKEWKVFLFWLTLTVTVFALNDKETPLKRNTNRINLSQNSLETRFNTSYDCSKIWLGLYFCFEQFVLFIVKEIFLIWTWKVLN